jgi:hypothetical protein
MSNAENTHLGMQEEKPKLRIHGGGFRPINPESLPPGSPRPSNLPDPKWPTTSLAEDEIMVAPLKRETSLTWNPAEKKEKSDDQDKREEDEPEIKPFPCIPCIRRWLVDRTHVCRETRELPCPHCPDLRYCMQPDTGS